MSLYIPKMSDTPGVTIPGLADNFNALADSQIVEYGENENGRYWRWENGLQICIFYQELIELTEPVPPGGRVSLDFAYPANFNGRPVLAVGGTLNRPGYYIIRGTITLYSLYPSRANVIVYNLEETHSGTALRFMSILAVGRWK